MPRLVLLLLIPVATAGCAIAPPPARLTASADPTAPVPPIRYANVAGGTASYRPVEPRGWEDLNKEITPKAPAATPAGKPQAMPGMTDGTDR